MYNFLSILTGALVTIMVSFNAILSKNFGNYTSTIIIHIVGLIAILLVLAVKRLKIPFDRSISLFTYTAGFIGVFTVLFCNSAMIALGASLSVALGLFGQGITSIIIDHYGLFGMEVVKFNNKKLIGFAIMVVGLIVMTIY
ncbi:DMT family transporter [Inconstantimicrobium mannanitabidum]|uniref:Membrane protein n=1 Tax=Inconstantimicrobium mannanitabidum TaxID=1604901 RepID=A0ACB5RBV1_9CLOT|nr:DMT family transporter [Clostridium sp. TW13]GKX66719.1 membrane protein [Clostridium sp. TW13]